MKRRYCPLRNIFNIKIAAFLLAIVIVVSAATSSMGFTYLNNIVISESEVYFACMKIHELAGINIRNSFIEGTNKLRHSSMNLYLKSKQKVLKRGNNIYICFKYTQNSYMHLVFGGCGINNIMGIKKIYVDTNKFNTDSTAKKQKPLLLMETFTDWIGPYYMKSLIHDDSGKGIFTGGWHGRSGDTTAKTEKITVKVNGTKIEDDKEYEGNVEIIVDNYIKAYNTINDDIYVLNEVVKYRISPGKIDVELVSTALEDVLIYSYYGLQSQNSAWNGKVVYGNGAEYESGKYSDSGPLKENNKANSYTLISKDGIFKLCVTIDAGFGLGKFENLDKDKPTAFTESYGKTYFNLVNGINKKLDKGEKIKWRGSYEFT